MIVGTIAVFFLKEIPLRGGPSRKQSTVEALDEAAPETEGSLATMS